MDVSYDSWEDGYPVTPKKIDTTRSEFDISVPEASDPAAFEALQNFSINNPDLVKLETIINEFNPFKVMAATDFEIRHSNVLAWLLDPNGHHGLGDTLFKNFLLEVLKGNRGDELPKMEDIIGGNFADLQILREWSNIDIIAISHQNKIVVVIENKINASESDNQLAKYAAIVNRKYNSNYKKVFVFLTLDGENPKGSELYIPFTHERIHCIVQTTVDVRQSYINAKVYDFIKQYLQILEEKTMQSAEFVGICSKLYREHRNAIKMITDYGKPKLTLESMKEFHKMTDTESIFADNNSLKSLYNFIPCAWSGIVPLDNVDVRDKYLVFFYFRFREYENHKITLILYVGNFPDPVERENFIEQLDIAFKANKNNKVTVKKTSKTGTTIYSRTIALKYGSDREYDLDDYTAVIEKLVEEYKSEEVTEILNIVDGVVKAFWANDSAKQS